MTRMNEQSRYHAEVMAEQEQEEAAQDEEMAYYLAQYNAEKASAPPDDCGYDLDDPKHPTYMERMCEAADFARDQAKDASYDKWLDQQEQTHDLCAPDAIFGMGA